MSPEFDTSGRVAVTDGLNIRLRTLQESSGDSILGDHNLPGRSWLITGDLSALSLGASEWVTENETSARVDVTARLNIGLQTLRENSGPGVLGNHNLPGQSRGLTEVSSTPSLGAPEHATPNVKPPAPRTNHREQPSYDTHITSNGLQQRWQHDNGFQNSEKEDIEMTNGSTNPPASKNVVKSSGLAASKYATSEAYAMTSTSAASSLPQKAADTSGLTASRFATPEAKRMAGASGSSSQKAASASGLTASKNATPEATGMASAPGISSLRQKAANNSRLGASKYATPEAAIMTRHVPALKPVTSPASAEMSTLAQTVKDNHSFDTTMQNLQDIHMPTSRAASDVQKMDSGHLSQTGRVQAGKALQEVKDRTASASAPSREKSNLGKSKWATTDFEGLTQSLSKQKLGRETPESASERSGRKENLAINPDKTEACRLNPFEMGTRLAKCEDTAINTSRTPAEAPEPLHVPMMSERAGNAQPAEQRPMTLDERMVQAMRLCPQADPVKFSSGDSTSSKTTKPVERKLANGVKTDNSSGPEAAPRNPKVPANLTTSKFAFASPYSYRRERRNKVDSDTEESEI